MPGDPLGVAGQLGEQVAVAQDHRVAQQVRHDVDDAGLEDNGDTFRLSPGLQPRLCMHDSME